MDKKKSEKHFIKIQIERLRRRVMSNSLYKLLQLPLHSGLLPAHHHTCRWVIYLPVCGGMLDLVSAPGQRSSAPPETRLRSDNLKQCRLIQQSIRSLHILPLGELSQTPLSYYAQIQHHCTLLLRIYNGSCVNTIQRTGILNESNAMHSHQQKLQWMVASMRLLAKTTSVFFLNYFRSMTFNEVK